MPELSDRTITYIIVAAIGFGLWLAFRWFRARQFKKVAAELEPEAKLRGWTFQSSGGSGIQKQLIEGDTDGIAWKLTTYDRPGSGRKDSGDFGESHTQWQTESVSLPGDMIAVFGNDIRRTQPRIRKTILPGMVKRLLDDDKSGMELFKRAEVVEKLSESVGKRYLVMASNAGGVERFLSAVETPLSLWPGKPMLNIAALYPGGLRIRLAGRPGSFQQVAALVDLGVGLAKAAKT